MDNTCSHKLPVLSIGTANFADLYGTYKKTRIDKDQLEDFLDKAWDLGFRSIDTAMNYKGAYENLSNLKNFISHNWNVTTKLPKLDSGLKEEEIFSNVSSLIQESLDKLKAEKIHTVLIHDPWVESKPKELKSILQALDSAYHKGFIDHYGLSAYSPISNTLLNRYLFEGKKFIIQGPLNIFDRRMEDYVLKKNNNIAFEARSIFLQGMLLDFDIFKKYLGDGDEINQFQRWLDSNNINPLQACISYAKFSKAEKIIIGFSNILELQTFSEIFQKIDNYHPPVFCTSEKILNPINWSN